MARAEKAAQQREVYKDQFVTAFQTLHEQGKPWVALGEATPVAASQDPAFVRQRKIMMFILGDRGGNDLPQGLQYPPKTGPSPIVAELIEEGIVERMEPHAVAAGLITHPKRLSPVNDGYLYRLVPELSAPEPQIDVAITA